MSIVPAVMKQSWLNTQLAYISSNTRLRLDRNKVSDALVYSQYFYSIKIHVDDKKQHGNPDTSEAVMF